MKALKILLATGALLCVALTTGCEPATDTTTPAAKTRPASTRVGVVVKRVSNPGGVFLVVTAKHGETRNVEVSRRAYARCTKGETYPKCAKR